MLNCYTPFTYLLTYLTQQPALRSVHPLSNERGGIKKTRKQNTSPPASQCRRAYKSSQTLEIRKLPLACETPFHRLLTTVGSNLS